MTRTIGDHDARHLGVIPDPEIFMHRISSENPILVIASDGVFGMMNNREIADMVYKHDQKTQVAISQQIIKEAHSRWKFKGSTSDDCTCVVVNFTTLG